MDVCTDNDEKNVLDLTSYLESLDFTLVLSNNKPVMPHVTGQIKKIKLKESIDTKQDNSENSVVGEFEKNTSKKRKTENIGLSNSSLCNNMKDCKVIIKRLPYLYLNETNNSCIKSTPKVDDNNNEDNDNYSDCFAPADTVDNNPAGPCNNMKDCKVIIKRLPYLYLNETNNSCIKSTPKVDDNNNEDNDNYSDCFAPADTVDNKYFVTTYNVPKSSIPNSCEPTAALEDNQLYMLLTKSDKTENRINNTSKNYGASNFGDTVIGGNRINENKVFFDNETNNKKCKKNSCNIKRIRVRSEVHNKYKSNKQSRKKAVWTKGHHKYSTVKKTGGGKTLSINATSTSNKNEKNKVSTVSDKNKKCSCTKLLTKKTVFKKRDSKPSGMKRTDPGRNSKIDLNLARTERMKVSSVSKKNNKTVRKTVCDKTLPVNAANTSNKSKKNKVSPVSHKNKKCSDNKLLTKKILLKKRDCKPSGVKKTDPGRNYKIDFNLDRTERIKVSSVSEKNNICRKCRSNIPLREKTVLKKRSPIPLSEGIETECGNNRRKVNVIGKKSVITKGQHSLPLTEKCRATEDIGKIIMLRDSPHQTTSRNNSQCSAGRSHDCKSVKRKVSHKKCVVPEKKRRVIQESLLRNQACDENPENTAATNANKECVDSPSIRLRRKHKQLAKGIKMFSRKEVFTNVVTASKKLPQAKVGESSSVPERTTSTNYMANETTKISDKLLSADPTDSQELKKSVMFNKLFAGFCMTYLKTSKCDPPCSLSHKVNDILIGSDLGEDNTQCLLKVLRTFVLEAPHPPLSLIEEACNMFAIHKSIDDIVNIIKIFTSQSTLKDNKYMQNLLKILIHALRKCCGGNETALVLIVKYVCMVAARRDSKQEMLDKMVTIIEETVKVNSKWNIYSSLAEIQDYVWPESLLIGLSKEFMNKSQNDLCKIWRKVLKYTAVILRNSHNKHLFSIWKRFPLWLYRLSYHLRHANHYEARILTNKLKVFTIFGSKKACKTQDQCIQIPSEDTRGIVLSNTGVKELEDMEEHPGTSTLSVTEISNISDLHNNNSNISVIERQKISPLNLLPVDFGEDINSLLKFLDADNFHHVLDVLDKWGNTQYISGLTEHLFILLREVKRNKGCTTYYNTSHGLLSTAINTQNLSPNMKKSLTSISVTLLLDMVTMELWVYAYGILEMILKHELICFSCKVYLADEYSPAKRNIAFARIYFANGDLESAVKLLIKQNMLALNRDEWYLKSSDGDMAVRDELIKMLMVKITRFNHLNISYMFLINLVEVQRNITQPINLVRPYESLLRKCLLQKDSVSMGLQLFKRIFPYYEEPVVFDKILCRTLVVTCANENEITLARLLTKKGYLIGAYTRNISMFSIKVSAHWTRPEIIIIIDETLNSILEHTKERSKGSTISTATVESDLNFAVVEEDDLNVDLPELLTNTDSSLTAAIRRLKSVLNEQYYPPLYVMNNQESGSPYIIIEKSVLVSYFSHVESTRRM